MLFHFVSPGSGTMLVTPYASPPSVPVVNVTSGTAGGFAPSAASCASVSDDVDVELVREIGAQLLEPGLRGVERADAVAVDEAVALVARDHGAEADHAAPTSAP